MAASPVLENRALVACLPAKKKGAGKAPFPARRAVASDRAVAEMIVDVAFGLVLGPAVFFLQLAGQLVLAAVDPVQVVIGQVAPSFLDRAFDLFPFPLDDILVHGVPP